MSEENNNQSFPADNKEKSPVIIFLLFYSFVKWDETIYY